MTSNKMVPGEKKQYIKIPRETGKQFKIMLPY